MNTRPLRRYDDARLVDLYPPAPGGRVIDFATGTGIVALAAAQRVGPHGSVLGIDIATGLLDIARAKAAAAGCDNVRFLEQNIEACSAPDGSVDAAYCSFAMVLLAKLEPFLARVRQLLAPGGFLAFTSNSLESYFNPFMLEAAAQAGITLPPIHGPLASPEAIRHQLERAGFGACRIVSRELGRSLPLEQAKRTWDGRLWLHPHNPLAEAPESTVRTIKLDFDRRLEAASRDGAVWFEERIHYVSVAAPAVVRVRLFAGLRERVGWAERLVPLAAKGAPSTPARLWHQLALDTGPLPATIRVAVNQSFAAADTPLSAGDEVGFLPPISGG